MNLRVFFLELKRRRVYRVAVAYAAVVFVIWQSSDFVLPALGAPGWVSTLVVILTLLGFPIALLLAWAFDITPEGLKRAEGVGHAAAPGTRRGGAVAVFVAGALLAFVAALVLLFPRGGPTLDRERVVVAVFENQTGDPALDPVGRMAQDWITQGIARTGLVKVVPTLEALRSFQHVEAQAGALGAAAGVRAFAEEAGAALVVWGSYYRQGEILRFQVQVSDASGRAADLVATLDPVDGAAEDPVGALEVLRQRVMGALASLLDPRLSGFTDDSGSPPTYEAYLAFVRCDELYIAGEIANSVEHCLRAYAADSTYVLPLLYAAVSYSNLQPIQADSLLRIAARAEDRLSRGDRLWLNHWRAYLDGDYAEALRLAREGADLIGGQNWHYTVGDDAIYANRPRETLEASARIDPARGWIRGWVYYWDNLTKAYHMLGDHERELQEARRGRRQYPESQQALRHELRALAALGRVDEVHALLEESRGLPGTRYRYVEHSRRAVAELRVHGYRGAADEIIERALDWLRARLPDEGATSALRRRLAITLYLAERWQEAGEVFDSLAAEFPEDIGYTMGYPGVVAARLGDRETALRYDSALAALDTPFLNGTNTYWRARVAAVLGDRDRAVELLRAAYAEGYKHDIHVHRNMDFESLYDYASFLELLRPKG